MVNKREDRKRQLEEIIQNLGSRAYLTYEDIAKLHEAERELEIMELEE